MCQKFIWSANPGVVYLATVFSVDPQIKSDIIYEIRDLGLPVLEAVTKYGVSSKLIYRWLAEGFVDGGCNLICPCKTLKAL